MLKSKISASANRPSISAPKYQDAFTLSEVLITLGIIGIIAAMTLPAIMAKHRKTVIETSLKKFYTTMNQAILRSVIDNGATKYSEFPSVHSPENNKAFYDRYFRKYVNARETKNFHSDELAETFYTIYFADGSGVMLSWIGKDWLYCTNAKYLNEWYKRRGSKCFMFGFYPEQAISWDGAIQSNYYNKGLEPYMNATKIDEDGNEVPTTIEDLYTQKWYAKAIQLNNWTIPDDYPVKY